MRLISLRCSSWIVDLARHDLAHRHGARRLDRQAQYHLALQGRVATQGAIVQRIDGTLVLIEHHLDLFAAARRRLDRVGTIHQGPRTASPRPCWTPPSVAMSVSRPAPPVSRLIAAVLMPPLPLPAFDVIIDRSARLASPAAPASCDRRGPMRAPDCRAGRPDRRRRATARRRTPSCAPLRPCRRASVRASSRRPAPASGFGLSSSTSFGSSVWALRASACTTGGGGGGFGLSRINFAKRGGTRSASSRSISGIGNSDMQDRQHQRRDKDLLGRSSRRRSLSSAAKSHGNA